MPSLHPDFDPNTLVLHEASNAEKCQSWLMKSADSEWRGPLTIEQFMAHQAALSGGDDIRYWVFTGPQADDKDYIFSTCYKVDKCVFVGGDTKRACIVGGVFIRVEYRRHGIASAMMRKLTTWLDGDEAGCWLSVLWSSVGSFYQPFGWDVIQTREMRIPVTPDDKQAITRCSLAPRGTAFLNRHEVNLHTIFDVEAVCSAGKDDAHLLAFQPSYSQAVWQFDADAIVSTALYPDRQTPTAMGAATYDRRVRCYWHHHLLDKNLTMFRFVMPSSPSADSSKSESQPVKETEEEVLRQAGLILRAAMAEAASWDLAEVIVWDYDARLAEVCERYLSVEPRVLEEMEYHIPCLRWKGATSSPSGHMRWGLREKYPWC